jgi:hypothetical protein
MAINSTQYQSMRLKFRGLLSDPFRFVSEQELDSFLGQLSIDVTGSVTAPQQAQGDALLAGALASPVFTPVAANVSDFLTTAIAALPAILTTLTTQRYTQLKQTLTAALSYAGIRNEAQMLGYMATFYDANFASFFTGVLQYLKSDKGITQTGGNITAWADQSGNGVNVAVAPTCTFIGTVGAGLNGHASVVADGVNHGGAYTLDLPAPGVTPTFFWTVWRALATPVGTAYLHGEAPNGNVMFLNVSTNNLFIYNTGPTGPVVAANNSWGRSEALYSNSALDYVKFGSIVANPGASTGNADPGAARGLFCLANGGSKINAELLVHIALNNNPTAPQLAAASAKVTSYYSSSVAV